MPLKPPLLPQDQSSASASATSSGSPSAAAVGSTSDAGGTPGSQPALRLTIYANSDAAYTLGEAQAKQLVSAYESYLSSSDITSGASFSLYETYGQMGGIGIEGIVMSTPNQEGLSPTIQHQQDSSSGSEAFMIPLSSSSIYSVKA